MKRRLTILTLTILAMMALISAVSTAPSLTPAQGATQISGIGVYAEPGACTDAAGAGADYVLTMSGDLSGCDYTFVETSVCSNGGVYHETGTETFVGFYNGEFGTFRTTYRFTAKYSSCPTFVGEKVGRCQHPIINGSGTGVFEGVKGRFDMKDDIGAGNFPYRGHLLY